MASREVTIGDSFLALRASNPPSPVLCEGPRGSGKTRSILSCLLADMLEHPGMKVGLCRSTRTRLTDQVLDTLETQVFPAFGMEVPGGAAQKNRSDYTLFNGSRFLLRGLDDVDRSKSFEATKIYVSECSELDDLNQFMGLNASLRQPGFTGRCLIGDINPVAPGFWANRAAEDAGNDLRNRNIITRDDYKRLLRFNFAPAKGDKWKRIITTHKDNPGYWDHVAWDWTREGLVYRKNLEQYTGYTLQRWFDGFWVAASGSVFPEWDESLHLADDFDPPSDWPQITLWDPGYGTTAIEFMTIADDGGIYVFDEIYERGHDVPWYCHEMGRRKREQGLNVLRDFGDPNEMFSSRAQGESVAKQAMEQGQEAVRLEPWPADKLREFDAGVELVRSMLINTRRAGQPGFSGNYLKVCRRCKGLRDNFASWKYKGGVAAEGEVTEGAERYEKANDHGIDCVRGGLSSRFLQRLWRTLRERGERDDDRG